MEHWDDTTIRPGTGMTTARGLLSTEIGSGAALLVTCYALLYRLNSVLKRIGAGRILPSWLPKARGLDHIKQLIQREVWVQVEAGLSQGMWMRLRLPGEGAYWRGTHEPEVQKAIFCAVRPGMVVYDIGAHLGSIALGTARLVGKLGCVVAFEWFMVPYGLPPAVREFLLGAVEWSSRKVVWKLTATVRSWEQAR